MRGRSLQSGFAVAVVALLSGTALADIARAGELGDIDVFASEPDAAKTAALTAQKTVPAALGDATRIEDAAAPNDPTAMDALFEDAADGKGRPRLEIDRADWLPEHAPLLAQSAKDAKDAKPAAKTAAATPRKGARETEDLDPEAEVTVPTATPSNDPLDRPKADAAKPGEAGKDNAGKDLAAKPADQPLPPLNAAIKAALDKRDADPKGTRIGERRKEREAISFFYAAHGFAPAWSANGKPGAAVDPLLARIAHADEDALSLPATPKALKTDGKPEEVAESDIALTEAVVAYARQATGARVEPRGISPLIGAKPELADPAEVIDGLIVAGPGAGDKLRALNPADARYVALRGKLAELRGARPAEAAKTVPAGPTLKLGMKDARVPLIRARLKLDAPMADSDALEYDSEIADAVADFQRANGLPASGTFTKKTQAAMSGEGKASGPKLEGAIVANMEMWRWMPRDLGTDRIEVNVPDYLVTVFHDNEPVATNRVVVGKTDTPTPLFSNTMKFLIVNPVWNVPQSIIENEMGDAPRAGFKARYVNGKLYLQQESGPKNALGRIKFMFPNDFSVYLHDTPSKSLFATTRRAYSHGCVRVDKPFEFAESVLNDGVPEGGKILWSQARLQKMLGDKERYVYLPKPLPIHIGYFTASVDPETGKVKTREDIYGYAHAVASALGKESDAPPPKVAEKKPPKPKRVADTSPRRTGPEDYYAPAPEYVQQPAPRSTGGIFGWFGR